MSEPKNRKDRALRLLAEFLLTFYFQLPEGEMKKAFKSQADLACISLPMKYRFSREEIANMKSTDKTDECEQCGAEVCDKLIGDESVRTCPNGCAIGN